MKSTTPKGVKVDKSPRRPLRSKAVTLQDIADQCGVSKVTVSLALRHDPRISKATTERILAAAEHMGYSSAHHISARRLALQKQGRHLVNNLIALCFPGYFAQVNYFLLMFHGVFGVLTQERYGLMVTDLSNGDGAYSIERLPPLFERGELDGAIFFPAGQPLDILLQHLRSQDGFGNRPVVSLIYPTQECSSVVTDDASGAYASVQHLIDLGHRHLLHFIFSSFTADVTYPEKRLQAVRLAMQDRGLDPERNLHLLEVSLDWITPAINVNIPGVYPGSETTGKALLACLHSHPEITAILAVNDPSAIQAWFCLQEAGYQVPRDISIIGFDDTDPMIGDGGVNLLTSVHLPLVELGREAARLVLRHVTDEQTDDTHLVLPTSLVIRESTGPAASR